MKSLLLITLLTLSSGCSFLACGDAGRRNCDGFLCLHDICNGTPLTEKEIKAGVKI